MFDSMTAGINYEKCLYCGSYHSYGPDICRGLYEKQAHDSATVPMIMIPDYKDQLQQIIDLLKEIRYNTDRLRVK